MIINAFEINCWSLFIQFFTKSIILISKSIFFLLWCNGWLLCSPIFTDSLHEPESTTLSLLLFLLKFLLLFDLHFHEAFAFFLLELLFLLVVHLSCLIPHLLILLTLLKYLIYEGFVTIRLLTSSISSSLRMGCFIGLCFFLTISSVVCGRFLKETRRLLFWLRTTFFGGWWSWRFLSWWSGEESLSCPS